MTKDAMRQLIVNHTGCSRASAAKTVDDLFFSIARALADGESVRLPSLGTLSVAPTAERTGRNPHTGEAITVAAGHKVKFKPGVELKDRVAKAARR
jgi:DNA-binding protein HU-beta